MAEAGKVEESMSDLHPDNRTEGARSSGFEKQVKPVLDLIDLGVNDTCLWKMSQKLCAGNSLDTLTILNKNNGQYLWCLLRNLDAGQEAVVKTGHGTADCFQIGKGVCQGCILSLCYLTYMQSESCEILVWMIHKLESKLPGEMAVTADMQMILL